MASNEPADTPRRRQMIEAAGRLFRANGFRAVTMEAIAAQSGVAKATLYSHFPDKHAVFTAVADRAMWRIVDALNEGLASTGSIDERLLRGLVARHQMIFKVVDGSPHARELMSARDAYARAPVEKSDAQMVAALVAVLREDPMFAKTAESIARTLFKGCVAVSGLARGEDELEAEIGNFVRPYLVGLRALAEPHTRQTETAKRAMGSGRR